MLPGLSGSLFIALLLLAVFQFSAAPLWLTKVLRGLYDTWLPMLAGLTLFALPRALLLVVLLEVVTAPASVHSAELLTASPARRIVQTANIILWRMTSLRWLLAAAVLTHWCFWDVSIVSILRPVRFEPVVTRLYDEMHYGHTELLVTRSLMTLLLPGVVFVLIAMVWRWLPKGRMLADG